VTDSLADIPRRLDDLMGFSAPCRCGKVHAVDMRGVSIRPGALEDVVAWTGEVGSRLRVVIVVDRITSGIAGERVETLLAKDGHSARMCQLPDGAGGRPHADDEGLAVVEAALEEVDLAVAVGSGTINDLTKLASYNKKIPYLVVATAPSMNGYTSAISAIMIKGVKRTLDCHQPLAAIADLDILQAAPLELVAAGLGDLESKPTSTADYRLGGRIRGAYYCPAPEGVVLDAEARVAEASGGLKRRDPEALALLTEALMLSGISMKLAGSSSPASGGEHLISHYWDMTAEEENRVEGWHGAQTGVATIVTATLYDFLQKIDPGTIDVEALVAAHRPFLELEKSIRDRHGLLAEEVLQEFEKKHPTADQLRERLIGIREGWADLWAEVGQTLRPPAQIKNILSAAGAAVTMGDLGLESGHLQRAFLAAREIRNRYTVLDLAADLGVLESRAGQVLQATGCLI
jgi:glycerol-1-phosphate dehydrogenase [NAD(P)+]